MAEVKKASSKPKTATAPASTAQVSPLPSQYESNPFNLITASIEAYKVNIKGLVIALIALFAVITIAIIITIVAIVAAMAGSGAGVVGLILPALLGLPLIVLFFIYLQNYLLVIMLAAAQGQRLEFGPASKQAVRLIPKMFAIGVLTFLAVFGGFLLFIIPGFIFMGWFALAPIAAIKENLGPIAAMKRSRELVRDHLIETWGLLGLQGTILGLVMLASMPIRYLQLVELKQGNLQKPELHWANYLAILIGMLSGITFNVPGPATQSEPPKTQPSIEQQLKDSSYEGESL